MLLPLPLEPLRYLVPFGRDAGPVGGRVAVPWQGGVRLGIAVAVEESSASRALELKEIIDWLDSEPYILPDAIPALADLAAYAGVPQGVLLATLLPGGFRDEIRYRVRAVEGAGVADIAADTWIDARDVDPAALALWRDQGLIHERIERVMPTTQVLAAVREPDEKLAGKPQQNQLAALDHLRSHGDAASGAALARAAQVPESAVRSLVQKGYAAYRDVPVPPPDIPTVTGSPGLPDVPVDLPGHDVVMVTGGLRSERLAACLPTLRHEVASGRTPLLLFPEQRFLEEAAELLASHVPVLMLSGESDDALRARIWEEIRGGSPTVLMGTYIALLAPRPRPGIIVACEAGAGTYKLSSGARLFVPAAARRIASLMSGRFAFADVLAGPELVAVVEPSARVGLPLPRMRLHTADLGGASSWPVGPELVQVLRQVESRDRQAIVLAPRRGFSGAFGCQECGWLAGCPNCDLALRYHRRERRLRCHQCGHDVPPPDTCPECGTGDLAPLRGAGTEWLAQAIGRLVPDIPVLRLDSDQRDDLAPLYAGEPGVIVGTTSVLRIAPLPRLSLIAVASLDTHMSLADFRAEEHALRMLSQLPELGTGAIPLTLVQTYRPEHSILAALGAEDPDAAVDAYLQELHERRKRFGYPPATYLAKLQLSAREHNKAYTAAHAAVDRLRTAGAAEDEVIGPAPAPVSRVRGQHTYQLFVRSPSETRFRGLLADVDAAARGVRLRVDVDPRDVGEFLE